MESLALRSIQFPDTLNYIQGIDTQKSDFDHRQASFLHGTWRIGGWWYYYLYALGVKVPLGTWGLLLLAFLAALVGQGYCASWRDELLLLAPAVTILVLVSSQTGFNHHSRYVIPVLPFFFVWLSKVARATAHQNWLLTSAVIALLAWSVCSSLWVYPHSFSYFNELAGGPKNGHKHLSESNVAWGQDLFYLRSWLNRHPDIGSLYLLDSAYFDPRVIGIEWQEVPVGLRGDDPSSLAGSRLGPRPGWYAINVCRLHQSSGRYAYFLRFRPVDMIGYSMYVYRITLEDANRVRRELGLPELPADWQSTVPPR
jgi:hypothetical protein